MVFLLCAFVCGVLGALFSGSFSHMNGTGRVFVTNASLAGTALLPMPLLSTLKTCHTLPGGCVKYQSWTLRDPDEYGA